MTTFDHMVIEARDRELADLRKRYSALLDPFVESIRSGKSVQIDGTICGVKFYVAQGEVPE